MTKKIDYQMGQKKLSLKLKILERALRKSIMRRYGYKVFQLKRKVILMSLEELD